MGEKICQAKIKIITINAEASALLPRWESELFVDCIRQIINY